MESIDSEIRAEIRDVLTSLVTGLATASGDVRNVFEYEVEDGLFLGVTPREDTDTIATIYVYIVDIDGYTDSKTSLEEHPDIRTLLHEIGTILNETFKGTEIDTETFPSTLDYVGQKDTPGCYYAMDLPREAAAA